MGLGGSTSILDDCGLEGIYYLRLYKAFSILYSFFISYSSNFLAAYKSKDGTVGLYFFFLGAGADIWDIILVNKKN